MSMMVGAACAVVVVVGSMDIPIESEGVTSVAVTSQVV